MNNGFAHVRKQAAVLALIVGLDLAVSVPIMGGTYRPFSWMSIASADAATLYPVIRNLTFVNGRPTLSIEVEPNARCVLQCNTNLLDKNGWIDLTETNSFSESMIIMDDTNPVSRSMFYRVKRILDTP